MELDDSIAAAVDLSGKRRYFFLAGAFFLVASEA
jgi:hypothetical protein